LFNPLSHIDFAGYAPAKKPGGESNIGWARREFLEEAKNLRTSKGFEPSEAHFVGSRARGGLLEDSDADPVLVVEAIDA
jgi:predicted nucleotidyltransferase